MCFTLVNVTPKLEENLYSVVGWNDYKCQQIELTDNCYSDKLLVSLLIFLHLIYQLLTGGVKSPTFIIDAPILPPVMRHNYHLKVFLSVCILG